MKKDSAFEKGDGLAASARTQAATAAQCFCLRFPSNSMKQKQIAAFAIHIFTVRDTACGSSHAHCSCGSYTDTQPSNFGRPMLVRNTVTMR